MLILIVIAAAVTLAAFVAFYEQQYDAEQAHLHQVQLESIRVVGIVTSLASSDSFATFQFTMASSDVDSIAVTDITINGFPLVYYTVTDLVNRTSYLVTAGAQLILTPDEEATVALNLTSGPTYSFVNPDQAPIPTSYATIAISTFLGNEFEQSFLPPTAVALVSLLTTYDGTTPEQIPLLDGSDSFQPGGNATIVSWAWTVSTTATPSTTVGNYSGEEAELTASLTAGDTYNIELVVTSSDGLLDSVTIQYTAPS
jgi:archaellum component FlaF (FlaF/FlaG flagellin family)